MTQIKVHNVTKRIKCNLVLEAVTLEMHEGKVYGLQGINGSGKTMLMRIIIGLIRPSEGIVLIDGKKLGKEIDFPKSIGFLLENPAFLGRYSGVENLKMLASINNRISLEKIKESLSIVGLDPEDKKKYKKYSLGMKQRLGIAAAIMENPDIIILDEPTNALDENGINLVKKILLQQKKRGALIIISCHDLGVLQELSDEIFKLEEGKIVEHILLAEGDESEEE